VLIGNPARGILLTGLRGVGKTVLLNVIRDQASELKYQVDLLEASEGSPLAPQIIPTLRQMLLSLSNKAKAADLVQRALRVLKNFQIRANVGGTDFGLKFDSARHAGNVRAWK
jgi:thymidylate kinase